MKKNRVNFILKAIVSFVLLFLVCWKVGPDKFFGAFSSFVPKNVFLAVLLSPLFIFLKIFKWWYLLNSTKLYMHFKEAAISYVGGLSVGIITPARTGELTRVLFLDSKDRVKGGVLVFFDKLLELCVGFSLAIIGGMVILGMVPSLILSGLTLAVLAAIYLPNILKRLFARFIQDFEAPKRSSLTLCLILSYIIEAIFILQGYLLISSFGHLPFKIILYTFPLITLTHILPITIGGLGVREGVGVVLLSKYLSPGAVVDSLLVLFAMNMLLPAIPGAIFITRTKRQKDAV